MTNVIYYALQSTRKWRSYGFFLSGCNAYDNCNIISFNDLSDYAADILAYKHNICH